MRFQAYPKYRESGVQWLASIPETWATRRVKSLFEIKKRIAGQEGYDVLSITQHGLRFKDLESNEGQLAADYSNYQFVEPGDFAMNHMDLLTGWIDLATVHGVTSPDYRVFSPRRPDQINPRYFLYVFQTAYREKILYALGQGASQLGRWRLPREQFNDFVLPFPPIEDQDAIVSVLDSMIGDIDTLIEEQRRLIDLLKEKRQAVISHAVTKGLNPHAPMKPSGIEWLGNIPSHWTILAVRRTIELIEQGWSPECYARPAEEHEWGVVKSGCVNRGVFDEEENKAVPPDLESLTEYEIRAGDVLMSRASGSPDLIGSVAYVTETRPKLMLSDKTFRITPQSSVDRRFFALAFNSAPMRAQIERSISGADGLANNLPQAAIRAFTFARPPIEEQIAIVQQTQAQTASIDSLIAELFSAIELLQERRFALISAAVTGKINVTAKKPVLSTWSVGFARQVLAAEILSRCNGPRMGRIKLQKLLHLCEYHAQLDELGSTYSRMAAGPFDARAMAGVRKGLLQQRWFEESRDGGRYAYRSLEKAGGHRRYLPHWEEKQARIDHVLNLLGGARTRTCEIASTLYAAWNDLLIEGKNPTDAEIIHEASSAERWHESKEKIAADKWPKALQWMRQYQLVPRGHGSHTKMPSAKSARMSEESA